jgi:hypothetical protein
MKIVVISYDAEVVTALHPFVMTAAAPEGTPPRRISDKKNLKKISLPAVPRRGPEADIPRIQTIFMDWVRLSMN